MTVKVALLKSGEEVIADIKEMQVESRVLGYNLRLPYIVNFSNPVVADGKTTADIQFTPWMPVSKDKTIPIPADWVVTIVEPVDKVMDMYVTNVLEKSDD
ncbi:MAG: hypothetical protein JSW00_05820 [Thermoplasmata archaeon]|jgi:hypothetical protein|nr:MAG: hypothetical protein JSW00_05820 [Thermoplasmata archaeon]|tara:strand:+ start:515 stop:814 length:300 start_codon:yes stop_codon:yes gene_type:complete